MINKSNDILAKPLASTIENIEDFYSYFRNTLFSIDFCNCEKIIKKRKCKKHRYNPENTSFNEIIIIYSELDLELKILFSTRISIVVYEKIMNIKKEILKKYDLNNDEFKGKHFFKEFFKEILSRDEIKEIVCILKDIILLLKNKDQNFKMSFEELFSEEKDANETINFFINTFIYLVNTRNNFAHDKPSKTMTKSTIENLVQSFIIFSAIGIFYEL